MSSRAVMYEFALNCFVLIKSHCIHKIVNNGSIYAHLEDSSCIHWSVPRFIVFLTQVLIYTVCLCLVCQLYHVIIVFPFFQTTTHNHSSPFICHLNRLCHWQGIQIIFAYDSRLIFCLLLLCPFFLLLFTTAYTASTLIGYTTHSQSCALAYMYLCHAIT